MNGYDDDHGAVALKDRADLADPCPVMPDTDMIDGFCDELRAEGAAPSTVRLRRYQIDEFARTLPAGRHLCDASRAEACDWLAGPVAAETRASRRSALSRFFGWAARRDVVLPKAKRPPGVPRPCPDAVVVAALSVAPLDARRAIVLARFAGLRACEVAAVHRRDLEDDGCLRVLGKGGKVRRVSVHPWVREVVESVPGFVFPHGVRGHWTAGTITKHVSAALPGAWTCHNLRHAFATQLYRESGCDLRLVQEQLGHSSPAVTARYVLVDDSKARRVVAAMRLAGSPRVDVSGRGMVVGETGRL